jgi:hypothetical protein
MTKLIELTNKFGCKQFTIDTTTFDSGKMIAITCQQHVGDAMKNGKECGNYSYINHRVLRPNIDDCLAEIQRRAEAIHAVIRNKN